MKLDQPSRLGESVKVFSKMFLVINTTCLLIQSLFLLLTETFSRTQGSGDLGSANAVGESTKLRAVVMTENESTSPLE